MEVAVNLRIKLILLTILHIVNATICIAAIFITSPIAKPVTKEPVKFTKLAARKRQRGKESEEEELLVDEEEKIKKLMKSISDDSVL